MHANSRRTSYYCLGTEWLKLQTVFTVNTSVELSLGKIFIISLQFKHLYTHMSLPIFLVY